MNEYPEKNNLFRLDEMLEAMQASFNNACEVKGQQAELIDLVKTSAKAEKFDEFVKDMLKQQDNLEDQIAELNVRISALERVCAMLQDAEEDVKSYFDDLLTALGVFR